MATVVNAQDIIVMKNGDAVQAKVQKITPTEIEYKKFSNLDGPIYTVPKASVLAINYQNGEKEIIKVEESNATEQQPAAEKKTEAPAIGEPDEARNKEVMAVVNNNNMTYALEKKGKKANYAVFQLYATENSQLANKDIEVSFTVGSSSVFRKEPRYYTENNFDDKKNDFFRYGRYIKIAIKNRTNKTIFIDLANTFFIRQDEASPYFVPSATSNTTTGSTGVGVNLGGITNAMGVGGALGSLASGVTVGGSKSSSSTTITYSQRIISIPPMSKKELEAQFFFPEVKKYSIVNILENDYTSSAYCEAYFKDENFKAGSEMTWAEDNSPLKFGKFITYSFDESMNSTGTLKIDFYLRKAIGFHSTSSTFRRKHIQFSPGTVAFTVKAENKK